jgi:hypothetical protein
LSNSIFCQEVVNVPTLTGTLTFLYDENQVDPIYRNQEEFKKLIAAKSAEIPEDTFLAFVRLCNQTYESEPNIRTKVALHMLFESTSQKFQRLYKIQQKKLAAESHVSSTSLNNMLDAADKFFSMDKSGVHPFNGTDPIGTH